MDEFFAENRLSAYIDNELPPEERPTLETSIRENPRLRVKYSRMLTAVELVRDKAAVSAPPGLEERVLDRLKHEGLLQGRWRRLRTTIFLSLLLVATVATATLNWIVQERAGHILSGEDMENDLPLGTVLLPTGDMEENKAPEEPAEEAPTAPAAPPTTDAAEATTHPVFEGDMENWEEEYALDDPEEEGEGEGEGEPVFIAEEDRDLLGSYRLYPENPDALRILNNEIVELGGEMRVGGRGLRRLSREDNFARIQLRLPEEGLAQLVTLLQQLGLLHQVQPPAESPVVLLQIEVQFRP
jgi:hypothetical protein